jgi:Icc-related predicted phosphoesterase
MLLREQNDAQRRKVFLAVAKQQPKLLIILGDLVSAGGAFSAWNYFDACIQPVRDRHIPIVAIPGNHEYMHGKEKGVANFISHFPNMNGRTWTQARCGDIAFVLLNSNFHEMARADIDTQGAWYARTLDSLQNDSSISSIVVGCHHPPFTNSTIVSENKDVQTRFVPLFARTPKAKLFISGHCHSYERFSEYGKTFVVSGGAGGPKQKVIIDPAKQRRRDLYIGPAVRPFHFCTITREKSRLRVRMFKLDEALKSWSLGDDFSLPVECLR